MIAIWSEKIINEYDWIKSTQFRNKNTAMLCQSFKITSKKKKKEKEKKMSESVPRSSMQSSIYSDHRAVKVKSILEKNLNKSRGTEVVIIENNLKRKI